MIIKRQKERQGLILLKNKGYAAAFAGLAMFAFLLVFAEDFRNGFVIGLKNCSDIVIPSLFPFLIASSLAGSGELPSGIRRPISALTEFLFGLPAESIFAVILGQLGGYLSGAKATQSLCSSGKISVSQAEKLMLFCINPGIGFTINALGSIMLSSRNSGRIIFFSICISAVICGIISRFMPCTEIRKNDTHITGTSFSAAVVNSVSSGTFSLLTACAFVCIFSGLTSVITTYITNEKIKVAAVCLLEITNGCIYASKEMSLPLISALCAFGGLCVHMQIFSVAESFKIKAPVFFAFRLLHAVLSFAVCSLILWLFPTDVQVLVNITPRVIPWSFSAPASFSLLFLSSLLILDLDNTYKI